MTPDELRALADALEPMARAPRFEDFDVPGFCAWVRVCADEKPVRAVPLGHALSAVRHVGSANYPDRERAAIERLCSAEFDAYTNPAPAAPQAERQPESEPTEAQIEAGARVLCHRFAELCNVNEQDTWNAHCDEFRDDAAEALRAALAAKDAT